MANRSSKVDSIIDQICILVHRGKKISGQKRSWGRKVPKRSQGRKVLETVKSQGRECLGTEKVSGNKRSQGRKCLGAEKFSGQKVSQGRKCLGAEKVSVQKRSWGRQCPGQKKSRDTSVPGQQMSFCFRTEEVSGQKVFRGR